MQCLCTSEVVFVGVALHQSGGDDLCAMSAAVCLVSSSPRPPKRRGFTKKEKKQKWQEIEATNGGEVQCAVCNNPITSCTVFLQYVQEPVNFVTAAIRDD